jgi:hypothetical protein
VVRSQLKGREEGTARIDKVEVDRDSAQPRPKSGGKLQLPTCSITQQYVPSDRRGLEGS